MQEWSFGSAIASNAGRAEQLNGRLGIRPLLKNLTLEKGDWQAIGSSVKRHRYRQQCTSKSLDMAPPRYAGSVHSGNWSCGTAKTFYCGYSTKLFFGECAHPAAPQASKMIRPEPTNRPDPVCRKWEGPNLSEHWHCIKLPGAACLSQPCPHRRCRY